jgi:hypothetical protein
MSINELLSGDGSSPTRFASFKCVSEFDLWSWGWD